MLLGMRVVVLGFALLGQSLLAHALMPEGRGAYAVCVLVGSLAAVAATPGADRGSQYFVMSGGTTVSQAISIGLTICVLGILAAVALVVPLIQSEFSFFSKGFRSVVLLGAFRESVHLFLIGRKAPTRRVQTIWPTCDSVLPSIRHKCFDDLDARNLDGLRGRRRDHVLGRRAWDRHCGWANGDAAVLSVKIGVALGRFIPADIGLRF